MAETPTSLALLLGRYAHVRELGRGGGGRVVLVRDTSDDALRALKVVDPDKAESLRWEWELGSRIRHPCLAEIFELLHVDEALGDPFHIAPGSAVLIEEYVEGRPSSAFVEELDAHERTLAALRMASDVGRALASIHAGGWIHGDVKPDNILVRTDGSAVLIDLGLAGLPQSPDGLARGTLGYLAPEAWIGTRSVGTDLYSLGATLLELLGGERSEGSSPFLDAAPPADIVSPIADLVRSLLAPDPAARPIDARSVLGQLDDLRRRLGERVVVDALPEPTSAERALRAEALPWVGPTQTLERLTECIRNGGVIRVAGPAGSGRTRLIREASRRLQLEFGREGRRVPTYLAPNRLRSPASGPCVLHLGMEVDSTWVEREVRAASVDGQPLAIVLEVGVDEDADVHVAPLTGEPFRRLLAELIGVVDSDLEARALAASGGLAGRLCRLCADAFATGAEPFRDTVHPTAALPAALDAFVASLAVRGGSVPRAELVADMHHVRALRRRGLGHSARDRFVLRRDLCVRHLEALDCPNIANLSGFDAVSGAYLAACRREADAEQKFSSVIDRALDEGRIIDARRLAFDAVRLLPASTKVRVQLGETLRALGNYDEALRALPPGAHAERAEIARRAGRREQAHRSLARAGDSASARVTAARLALSEGQLEMATLDPALPLEVRAELEAWLLLGTGDVAKAGEVIRSAWIALDGRTDREARRALARLRSSEGSVAHAAGRPELAAVAYEAAGELAQHLGEAHLEASSIANLGAVLLDLGRLGDGLQTLARGGRRLLRLGRDRDAARALLNLASGSLWIGDDPLAARAAKQADAAAARAGDAEALAFCWLVEFELALRRGRVDAARAMLEQTPEHALVRTRAAALWAAHGVVAAERLVDEADTPTADAFERAVAKTRISLARGEVPELPKDLPQTWERRLVLALLEVDVHEVEPVLDPVLASRAKAKARRCLDDAARTLSPAQRRQMRRVPGYQKVWATVPAEAAPRSDGRWRRLSTLAKTFTAEKRVARLREAVVAAAMDLVDAERGFWVERVEEGQLRLLAVNAWDEEHTVSRSVVARALDGRRTIRAVDALEDERLQGAQSVHAMALRSVLCVPLRIPGHDAALIVDDRLRPAAFVDDDAVLLEDLCELASIAYIGAERLRSERSVAQRLEQTRRRLVRELETQRAELDTLRSDSGVVALSAPMRKTMDLAGRVAKADAPVLIVGESGTGKERVARAVHAMSGRREGPFVAVSCAAIPETLLESAIFGHERGAFTGASKMRRGLFEMADGGTLLLDEIGEMPASMQAKLLRVVQEGEFRRVGGERVRRSDVRLVGATHRDMRAMVEAGEFREDLFYRLAVVTLDVPPLRERGEDFPLLVHAMLDELGGEGARPVLTPEALGALSRAPWPGNVRQLRNVLERAMVIADGEIGLDHIGLEGETPSYDLKAQTAALESRLIRAAMHESGGNQTKAAELLGLSRYGLQKKLKRMSEAGVSAGRASTKPASSPRS